MPHYEFILGSGATSGKFEDDADDVVKLHERVDAARTGNGRFVTFVTLDPEPAGPPRKVEGKDAEGKTVIRFEAAPIPPPEVVVTGSWDANDVKHVIPFEEALEVEFEGDEQPEDEAPVRLPGKGKK